MEVPPSDLSQDDKKIIFGALDVNLNRMILESLLHGIYTGVIAVTLWTISVTWYFPMYHYHHALHTQDNIIGGRLGICPWWKAYYLIGAITGGIGTLLVDVIIIWRCWVLWDYQWRIVLLPIICAMVTMSYHSNTSGATCDSQADIEL
ncbi:hypothetical protein ARMGADRAFT_1022899 [Armillaria gallica]|uniref:Uncharacterized protein n=1 Tax=Armillaria gallica TaxID=47427 RepID=A0A2H3EE50_ARMGA|nr:hypothetical protein ARMGADRAFT_1022899 [Armillaria gallica]